MRNKGMDTTQNANTLAIALLPIVNTLILFARDPGFTWSGCIPYIIPMLASFVVYLPSWRSVADSYKNAVNMVCCKRNYVPVEFTARLALRSWADEPESLVRNFCILFWEWNRENKTVGCKHLLEESVNTRFYGEETTDTSVPLFVDDLRGKFWHEDRPEFQYTMWVDRREDREGRNVSEMFLRIACTNGTSHDIIQHVEFIKSEALRVTLARKRTQKVLVSTMSSDESKPVFMVYNFASTSSFDNFYSDEARSVSADLDHFLNNKSSYMRTGKPYTYTVLNTGPPGVGKTKLVKAIAARTGRTLIVLNLKHISSIQVLYEAFHSSTLAGEHIPHDSRLYYIPEVDTQLFEVLKSRSGRGARKSSATDDYITVDKENAKTLCAPAHKPPTLGEILNVLDGVPERHGHILVLDTNHLADLDPALVRPGRVDRILSWGRMTGANVRAYLENYFDTVIPKSVMFPDDHWTAAELQGAAYRAADWRALPTTATLRTAKNRK